MFAQIFGGQRGGRRGAASQARRGGDVQTQVAIPFMDAVNGTKREVSVMANVSVAALVCALSSGHCSMMFVLAILIARRSESLMSPAAA